MESNYQQQESNKGSSGVGRWYECVYCKRGFNTAQALGGHMNIHRKKRDGRVEKNIESIVTTTNRKQEEEINHQFSQGFSYHDQNFMQASSSSYNNDNHHHHFAYDHQPRSSTSTRSYFPDNHHQYYDYCSNNRSEDFLGNGECNVGLDYNSVMLGDLEKNREVVLSQKEELDLELRLGL